MKAFGQVLPNRFLGKSNSRRFSVLILPFLAAQVLDLTASGLTGAFVDSEYAIDAWETEQGLPENSATAMVQTPDGYLWFGTFNGLVRFNGVGFTVFDASNTPELPSSGIVNLHLDAQQRLWISTLRGLVVTEPGRWTAFHREPAWTADYVRTFSERAGVICLTSFTGKVFRAEAGRLTELPDPAGRRAAGYHGYVDPAGRIWVVQDRFFGYWDGNQWRPSELSASVTNDFQSAATLRDGRLLVLKRKELLRIDHEQIVSRQPLSQEISAVWRVDEDRAGTIWLSARGLYRIRPSGEIRHYTSTNGLTYHGLRFAFEDREGNLWAGTSGGGLMRLKPRTFRTFDTETALNDRNVKAVVEEPSGRILIGNYRGTLYGWEAGRFAPLEANRQPAVTGIQCLLMDRERNLWVGTFGTLRESGLTILTPSAQRRIPSTETGGSNIRALYEDSHGRIWIGGSQNVSVYATNQFQVQNPGAGLELGGIRSFAEHPRDGTLWAVSAEGLFKYAQGQWSEIRSAAGQSLQEILCLHVAPDGALWLGGAGIGLLRYHHHQWSRITEQHGLPTRNISCILEDDFGYWWLGSNRGIVRALYSDVVAVADGVVPKISCHVFNLSDGLASVECAMGLQSAALKDRQGRLWFATLKGVAAIDPRQLQINPHPPPVHLETIRYLDRRGRPVNLTSLPSPTVPIGSARRPEPVLTIPPGSSQLSMQFAALSFTAPEKVRLRFELRHNHKLFLSEEGTRRTVVAPWLPPGTYHLRVTAANNDGVWNPDGTALAFVVRPFYWQIAWLRFLALAGVVSAVAVAAWWITRERLRRRIERLEHERSLKEERLKLQQQLLQAQKMESIGRLAGGVAHDFNNMLQVILGNTFLALNHAPADRPLRECLEEIHKSAQHSADLTRQLLAFARKQTVAPKILDLNDTVSGMLKMLQRLIGESIQLVFLPGANLWPVKMDPSQIDQILANLTVNARDAIDQVGQVTLETANVSFDDTYARSHLDCVPGEYVMLAVSDNGRGMSAEIREHLFEPFFTTKALGQGTGLGLATVFGIVKQNGGLINVYSEPGQGAVFKIYLPRAVDAAPAKPSVAPAPSVPHGSETILLVEDEAQILNLGRRILTQHGYRVWVARTPEEAIAIASQHPHQIDLLITDVVMPGMNGRELSQRIAAHQPGLRRVFMSGYTSNVIVHHGVLDDGVEFLQKPFTIQTLTDKIRAVLAHPPHSGAS